MHRKNEKLDKNQILQSQEELRGLDKGRDRAVALVYADLFDSGLASVSSNLAHNMLSLCGSRFSLPEVPHSAFSDSTSKCHLSHTVLCC